MLSDPRQKRFFKSKDMRDLFTLGDEYANATETSEIFASVNGEVTAALQAEQPPFPDPGELPGASWDPVPCTRLLCACRCPACFSGVDGRCLVC